MIGAEIQQHAEKILKEMSLEEKLGQIQCFQLGREPMEEGMKKYPHGAGEVTTFGGKHSAEENAALAKEIQDCAKQYSDIPPIMHGEAVTGVNAAEAEIFPSAIGLGATWKPETVQRMADLIRKQMLSIGVRHALSPVMDVARDPRCGRTGETYGEDPTLCSAMSVAFVRGLQGNNLKEGVLATGKHFLGYGRSEGGLNMAANPIPARELREVYAKPFQAAISEANLGSVMNSYGTLDGELVIQSENILNDLLRDEMKFDGIVVSDYMSIDKAVDLKMAETKEAGGEVALRAGLDIELPTPYGYTDNLLQRIRAGEFPEELLDRAVRRVLIKKLELGLMDDPYPRTELLKEAYQREPAKETALQAARESIVLLQNDGILPLKKTPQKIAVIGPHGDSLRFMFGCYTYPATLDMILSGSMRDMAGMENIAGDKKQERNEKDYYPGSSVKRESQKVTEVLEKLYGSKTPTICQAIREKCPEAEVIFSRGCDLAGNDRSGFAQAVKAAEEADTVICCVGGKYGWGSNCTTGEGIDTDRIGLPGIQEDLVKEICNTGKPVVLVHMDAKPLSSLYIKEHCNAVLEIWFPGDTGGAALTDVLFGDYNPAGRLPMTAARTEGQIPIYAAHKRGSGYSKTLGMTLCKYVEGDKKPLYYFGEGKSYTTFAYSDLSVQPSVRSDGSVTVSLKVKNTGGMDGDEVVQLYVSDQTACMIRPVKELAGFARVFLKKGEEKTLSFRMKASQFAFLDQKMNWLVEAGKMTVMAGGSSEDLPLTGEFVIEDTAVVEGSRRGFFAGVVEQ